MRAATDFLTFGPDAGAHKAPQMWVAFLLMAFFAVAPLGEALAQCAMCAATVEANAKEVGRGRAESLNAGILYLMVVPYLLLSVVGFVFWRNARRRKAVAAAGKARTAIKSSS